jgi:hypothetical protein
MNSILIKNEEEKQEIEYPCLMEHYSGGFVVLMTRACEGVVVSVRNVLGCTGEYRTDWNVNCFKPLGEKAQVVLSNGSIDRNKIKLSGTINLDECKVLPKEYRSKQDTKIRDKDLVWCWEDSYTYARELRFYDAKNEATFYAKGKGERDGAKFKHYEKYLGEYPDWAKEAQKTLEN